MKCLHKWKYIGTINDGRIVIHWCTQCGTIRESHFNRFKKNSKGEYTPVSKYFTPENLTLDE